MSSRQQEQTLRVLGIAVKNTFLCAEKAEESARSKSVPPSFKPRYSITYRKLDRYNSANSDDATSASDKDTEVGATTASDSEQEYSDHQSDFSDCSPVERLQTNKVTLNLLELTDGMEKARCKLRPQAQPFKSVRTPPAEVLTLISCAMEVLASGHGVDNVQLMDGGMGGTSMIVAQSRSTSPDVQILSLVQDALMGSAEQSENTYVLGYGAQPFTKLDLHSFRASIAHVPAAHHATACWDTYEQGSCPRRCGSCRWDHPSDVDIMRLIVMIKPAA
jgi:hypothetical protein